MKRNSTALVVTTFLICLFALGISTEAGTRFGGGIHYLKTLGEIKDAPEFDENAVGIMASIVLTDALMRIEGDLEFISDFGGSGHMMIQPQAYAMLGESIYGGLGIGIGYLDGEWQSNPFYALRAGIDFKAGNLDLDLFMSYRFQKANDLEYLGSDDLNSVTFGALLRFGGK